MTGIYSITNLFNNKIYIGWTSNFNNRKSKHFYELLNNIHKNQHLQKAFNKYGIENFKFEILEICALEYCLSQENYWANMLNVHNKNYGYNKRPTSPLGKTINTLEIRQKISSSNKGKKQSKETIEKRHLSRLKNKGFIFSEEHKLKLSIAAKNRPPMSLVTREKISSYQKAKPFKRESIDKMLATKLEKKKIRDLLKQQEKINKIYVKRIPSNKRSVYIYTANLEFIKEVDSICKVWEQGYMSKISVSRALKNGKSINNYKLRYKNDIKK